MSPRVLMAATLGFGMLGSGLAFAQTMTAPNNSASNSMNQPGMAATSSDGGKTLTGASSAAIGTGNVDKTGVMSPKVPGYSKSNGETGANPNNAGGVPSDKTGQ